jgi:hypothetical protein
MTGKLLLLHHILHHLEASANYSQQINRTQTDWSTSTPKHMNQKPMPKLG